MSKVCQLFSGSSGNSILISSKGHNFLVDIGVSAKRCETALLQRGVAPESIDGILITHEHNDHTAGLRVFASRHNTPVFAADSCIDAMDNKNIINDKVHIEKIDCRMELGGVEIKAFKQSHDRQDCVGYKLELPNGRSAAVCTDTGYVTDNAKEICSGVDLIFVESNHETSMVETGPYPYYLKQRILGTRGHLSNFACGEFIKELAQSGTTRFVLSHLSRENNMPHLARQNAIAVLDEIGLREESDFRLYVASPESTEQGIVL